ncbi:MAG: DUF2087 domain-containing protein [Ignavibacteriae bacterium]|nr:MAG: DUF2087 domain-containing protein [Ignavibacteriota bacterium]
MPYETELKGFLDKEGKLKQWPSKQDKRKAALDMISEKFETDKTYNEKEVNEMIKTAISFGDHQTVRRELVSAKILDRTPDGAKYWKVMQTERPGTNFDVPK